MLEIFIPSKPAPVPPAKYLPLTNEEQEEVDFYKKRKSRYEYLLVGLVWLFMWIKVKLTPKSNDGGIDVIAQKG